MGIEDWQFKMANRESTVACVALVLGAALSAADAASVTLVRDGRPASIIVTADRPVDAQAEAAKELREHLRLMSGAGIPIVRESGLRATNGTALILVGQSKRLLAHGLDTTRLKPETFVVRTQGNVLMLASDDGRDSKTTRTGTLWAVYDFLQDQLGCRWVWPGDIGRVVPRRSSIVVHDLDIQETPLIKKRHFRATLQPKHRTGYEKSKLARYLDMGRLYDQLGKDEALWQQRMRMGRSFYIKSGHAFTSWWDRYRDKHPGIFAMQLDGRRRPRKSKRPDFVKMCVSNPRLWAMQLAPLRKAARKGSRNLYINTCENDGRGGFCLCKRCRAWDADLANKRSVAAKVEDGFGVDQNDGRPDRSPLPDSLSDRYTRWYNDLAVRARAIHPAAIVVAYAYSRYRNPPTTVHKIEPNVWIGYVGFNAYPAPADYTRHERESWLGWSSKGATVFLRSNSLYYAGEGAPYVFTQQLADDFRFQVDNGLRWTDYDCLQGYWATSGPSYYVQARLLWDTHADVAQLLDGYYEAFGPLAPVVREYFGYWERFTTSLNDSPLFRDQRRPDRLKAYPKLYTHRAFAKAEAILAKAKPLLAQASKEERERFRNIELGLEHGRLLVAALGDGKVGNGPEGRKLMQFRRRIAPRNVVNVYWTTWKEMRYRVFE